MSEIKVGDLVMVVGSGCAHNEKHLGEIHRVMAIVFDTTECAHRGLFGLHTWRTRTARQRIAVLDKQPGYRYGLPLTWLKRIPPIADLEGSTTEALDPADCLAAYESKERA